MRIRVDDCVVEITKPQYVRTKTRDLIASGYNNLTEKEVGKEVDLILSGQEPKSIIGKFIEGDIILDGGH